MGKSKSSCHCNGAQLQHSKVSTTTEKIESTNLQTPERWISKKSWIRCGLFLTKTNTYSCWPTYMLLIWLVPRRGIFQEASWEGPWEGPKWMSNSKNFKGPSNFVAKASNLHQRLMTGRPLHLFYPIRTPPATSWRSYFENSNRYHRSWPRQKDLPALPRVAVEPRVRRWPLSTSGNRLRNVSSFRSLRQGEIGLLSSQMFSNIPIMDLKMWLTRGLF